MNESKERLEATIKGLEEKILSLNGDLTTVQRDLVDISKPELASEIYDIMLEAIEEGVGNFDFDNSEQYDIEYEIDYDGRVKASSIEFNSASELNEKIMNKIEKCFKVPHIEQ